MRTHDVGVFNWATVPAIGTVTPGASNVEGAYVACATSAEVANDVYFIEVMITGGATAAAVKDHLLDIGVDPAGGTSFTARISNIVCGQSGATSVGGNHHLFPLFVKSGSSIGCRIQGSNATAGTVAIQLKLYGKPNNPELVMVGQYAETVGTITNSGGVAFTPGNSNVEGSWVSLGTTAKNLWWWQVCCQTSDSITTAFLYMIDLAYGDATNKTMIIENSHYSTVATSEAIYHPPDWGYCEVPAGATIYVRGTCSGVADATGWTAVAVGIGG